MEPSPSVSASASPSAGGGDDRRPPVVVVVNGGELTARALAAAAAVAAVPGAAEGVIIAADGGLDRALSAGLHPTVLVGDLDSISDAGRAWADANAVTVDRYPTDKDFTDTELALTRAAADGPADLLVLAGVGDRLDHTLGTLTGLGGAALHHMTAVRMVWGDTLVQVAHGDRPVTVHAADGSTFSLVTLHGPCHGVTVHGARWPLDDADLPPASSRGLSNEIVADRAEISLAAGVLTVVQAGVAS